MKKITMMDNLTLYINKKEYKLEIDEKFTNVRSLEDIEDLEETLPGFFDVESISRQHGKVFLVYEVPEGYEPLEKAKKYVPVIKLQLIKNLLDADPLLEADGMSYLDLNNIFFKDFNDIKMLYRSNGFLPFHKGLSTLDQYKLFIMGFFSDKYSYKRFIVNKDKLLLKEKSEFLFGVNAATDLAQLRTLVDKELEKEQNSFYEKVQFQEVSKKKGFKRKIYTWVFGVLIVGLLFAGAVKQNEKNIAADYEDQLAAAELDNELTIAVSGGDTEKATKLMEEKGEDLDKVTDMLIEAGKFDEAIAYDKDSEKKVVSYLYKVDQTDKLLELKSKSTFLDYEKEIVLYDADDLNGKASLIEDKGTLKRLALAFIKHENFDYAQGVLTSLKDDPSGIYGLSKAEKEEVSQYLDKADLEMNVIDLNDQISALKDEDPLDETEEQLKEREKEIEELEDSLVETQKKLIKLDEKLGMDA
ncbi:hypothetical protein GZ22_18305 (plasmid) [Terribacillus saccharophilus]|uniref:Type VII secretion protein EssB n=1 Tax=Terribacillus saccharophilus TaxID=361277 RepID=A0A075LNV0_9BACI|nr:hypothetical protein [Terribacillus goriensis]AIF68390.1 hypothetical protein GZ22_18305 [Terribacillus goriensis]